MFYVLLLYFFLTLFVCLLVFWLFRLLLSFFLSFSFIYFVIICPVPGCSGMFQNVPGCSMFRVLLTPDAKATDSFRDRNLSPKYSCGLLRLRLESDWSQNNKHSRNNFRRSWFNGFHCNSSCCLAMVNGTHTHKIKNTQDKKKIQHTTTVFHFPFRSFSSWP